MVSVDDIRSITQKAVANYTINNTNNELVPVFIFVLYTAPT